jgi:hypothetical protein
LQISRTADALEQVAVQAPSAGEHFPVNPKVFSSRGELGGRDPALGSTACSVVTLGQQQFGEEFLGRTSARRLLLLLSPACGDCVDTGSMPSVLVTAASWDRG